VDFIVAHGVEAGGGFAGAVGTTVLDSTRAGRRHSMGTPIFEQ
jgi:hypothetical protein